MDGQLAVTGMMVVAAALFVLRAAWRAVFNRATGGCGSGCGKCPVPDPVAPPGRINLPQLPSH